MIQRIQSVFLLGAFILHTIVFVLPLASFPDVDGVFTLKILGLYDNSSIITHIHYELIALNTLCLILVGLTIFQYKNRKKQMQFCTFSIGLIALLLGLMHYTVYNYGISQGESGGLADYGFGSGIFFPIVSILLIFFAKKYIKKDDDLIRSMDRLR